MYVLPEAFNQELFGEMTSKVGRNALSYLPVERWFEQADDEVFVDDAPSFQALNCTFSHNNAGYGGAVYYSTIVKHPVKFGPTCNILCTHTHSFAMTVISLTRGQTIMQASSAGACF